jgi:hypothetical protein
VAGAGGLPVFSAGFAFALDISFLRSIHFARRWRFKRMRNCCPISDLVYAILGGKVNRRFMEKDCFRDETRVSM